MNKLITLQPIRETLSDYERIEKAIKKLFREEIYLPLLRDLRGDGHTLQNSMSELFKALQKGDVVYARGSFSGKFNSSISKQLKQFGAVYDRSTRAYKLAAKDLPREVKEAISISQARFQEKLTKIDITLAQKSPAEIAGKIKVSEMFESAIFKVQSDFEKSVRSITVAPQLTPVQKKQIADEWQTNLEKYIKDFTGEEIIKLRANLQKSALAGNRYQAAQSVIQKSYDVSADKARFLARQETSLLMAKYKQVRYQEVGINEYLWKCVAGTANHPVRPMHRELNDKSWAKRNKNPEIFNFSNPPVTNPEGNRNNPGEDYNCRCVSIPIVSKGNRIT